jgi:hypothetical protein
MVRRTSSDQLEIGSSKMKNKCNLLILISFIGITVILAQFSSKTNENIARWVAQKCVLQEKVGYDVVLRFNKGDFSDNSKRAKCFLKCFAYKSGFYNSTGHMNVDQVLNFYIWPDKDKVSNRFHITI